MNAYILTGEPVALSRPRFSRFSRKPRVYDSQKDIKLIHGLQIKSQHGSSEMYSGALLLTARFYTKKPKKFKKGQSHLFDVSRPDLDNYIKYLMDVCTGILYKDDAMIIGVYAFKQYSDNPRTEFVLNVEKDIKFP